MIAPWRPAAVQETGFSPVATAIPETMLPWRTATAMMAVIMVAACAPPIPREGPRCLDARIPHPITRREMTQAAIAYWSIPRMALEELVHLEEEHDQRQEDHDDGLKGHRGPQDCGDRGMRRQGSSH